MVARDGLPPRDGRLRMTALIRLPYPTAIAMLSAVLPLFAGVDPARAAADVAAAVVLIGDLPSGRALEAARDQVPGRWRLELLKPESRPPLPPRAEVELLSRAYLNADFLRCLTELQRPSLDTERLLEENRRAEAAQVGMLAAACSLGAGDEGRARDLVRRLFVRDLDEPDVL